MGSIATPEEAGKHPLLSQLISLSLSLFHSVLILATVARVAYLASDFVLSVQPFLRADTPFSKHLNSQSAAKVPNVVSRTPTEVSTPHRT